MTKAPRILSLALVALAGAAIIGSLQRDVWTDLGPGPGFFPLVVGGLLLVLSVALTVELVRHPDDDSRELATDGRPPAPVRGGTADPEEKPRTRLGNVPGPILVVSALVVALMLMNVLGFRISIALLVLFVLAVVERMRLLHAAGLALAISFGSFYLFADLLDVQLQVSGWGL
ncbi:tripartite tricarboxylate transporter TctB family protein [Nonomuraea sp. NPDC046570]|uniref:tripartite tricarboxylate transporter TctB family protein n=1 Tax=Nonomuraea sp. NPDC046570 TaxID=3155255 RepID=UPI0033FE22A7